MVFLIIMVLVQLAVVIPLLVVVIRERWPWLLSVAFVINEATILYFWAAPLMGQDPFSVGYLFWFWTGPVSTLVCGILLNLVLPPLPTRLARICHPQGLILVYLLILFLWAPFVFFGFFIGDIFLSNNYINYSQYVTAIFQIFLAWLGLTLLFAYLYRAARRSGQTFPDLWECLWEWWIGRIEPRIEPNENLDSERGGRTHLRKR